jgi:hypothetical protein
MQIRTRAPDEVRLLQAGERTTVEAGRPHRVSGVDDAACRFVIVQGVGRYDYIADPQDPQPE